MQPINRPTKEVTPEWLASLADDQGLTRGQTKLLEIWCGPEPAGKQIPVDVATFIEKCKGYRGMSEAVRGLLHTGGGT